MNFEDREISFGEADRRYAELKRQFDTETINTEEFDAQRRRLMVRDDEGRWWAKSRDTGEWNYHDGSTWVRATPPGYQTPRTPPAESAPDRPPQPEQGGRATSSQPVLLGSSPVQDGSREKQHRGVHRWLIIGVGLLAAVVLVVVGIIVWGLIKGALDSGGSQTDEASRTASGYTLFSPYSGALSVEVPSEWDQRSVVDSEGENGRASWTSFLGEGESPGPSITAANDLKSWRDGTEGHKGIYTVASKKLAQGYSDDELVTSGPNDYSSSCEAGTPQDFERSPYSGKILLWNSCGGDSDHAAITLAIGPKSRECVIVAQIGGYFQANTDEENIQHVLDTLKTDCNKID